MRLYAKLFALILLASVLQFGFLDHRQYRIFWFGLRCEYAYATHNSDMVERLITEIAQLRDSDMLDFASVDG